MNYLPIEIAGQTLGNWLLQVTESEYHQNILAWAIIHICFAYYHISGPFFDEEDLELIQILANRYHPNIAEILQANFFIYIYHYTVGKYGHLPANQGFIDIINNIITTLANDQEVQLQFELRPEDTAIPHPISLN